jgi:hypothetical protein
MVFDRVTSSWLVFGSLLVVFNQVTSLLLIFLALLDDKFGTFPFLMAGLDFLIIGLLSWCFLITGLIS